MAAWTERLFQAGAVGKNGVESLWNMAKRAPIGHIITDGTLYCPHDIAQFSALFVRESNKTQAKSTKNINFNYGLHPRDGLLNTHTNERASEMGSFGYPLRNFSDGVSSQRETAPKKTLRRRSPPIERTHGSGSISYVAVVIASR